MIGRRTLHRLRARQAGAAEVPVGNGAWLLSRDCCTRCAWVAVENAARRPGARYHRAMASLKPVL